ncbi:MAG TPA: hypothetical protein VHQ94_07535 [Pyrinomonadaceae bacterium]|jgi:hypothetical protein|nr:hypothetical protein [Pyrinomonadaceae bacterium]
MLFLESKTLNYAVEGEARTRLLQQLEERELTPLIRSTRLRCFEDVLLGIEHVRDVESSLASWSQSTIDEPYVRGDLFCFHDYILFVIFENETTSFIRAGIVYQADTPEPFRKLDSFCEQLRTLLSADQNGDFPHWQLGKASMPQGFRTFVERQDADSLYTSLRKETMSKRILAASKLEDEGARVFLRTARNAHQEGYAAKLLTGNTESSNVPIQRLEDAGLVEREVQISCRKTGHALFRLPNPHALAVVTVSDATCSECGSPVADENVEEVIAPTQLASSLLEDGSWLVSRLHFLLREMGVPEREIAVGPSEGNGYGQLMANICGESFLMVTRDGDLTPAFARWAIDLEIDTEASHLVIVATGRIHREAGVLLQNHSRRRVSGGQDFEMILADDAATAGRELEAALERVSQRVVAEQLCVLDNSLGLSVSRLVLTKFNLLRARAVETSPEVVTESEPEFSVPTDVPASVPTGPLTLAARVGDDLSWNPER